MTPEETKDMAEAYRLALIQGMATVEDVVAWGEKVIEVEADPSFEIIEIASSPCSVADMVSKLSGVPGESDPAKAIERLFGIAGDKLAKDTSKASSIAGQLRAQVAESGKSLPSDVQTKVNSIDDGFASGNTAVATRDLADFLGKYRQV